MPLNTSGPISLGGATAGQSINLELSQPATSTVALNDTNVRTLAGVPGISTQIVMPTDFYGKPIASGYALWVRTTPNRNMASGSFANVLKTADDFIIQFTNRGFSNWLNGQYVAAETATVRVNETSGNIVWSDQYTYGNLPNVPGPSAPGTTLFQDSYQGIDPTGSSIIHYDTFSSTRPPVSPVSNWFACTKIIKNFSNGVATSFNMAPNQFGKSFGKGFNYANGNTILTWSGQGTGGTANYIESPTGTVIGNPVRFSPVASPGGSGSNIARAFYANNTTKDAMIISYSGQSIPPGATGAISPASSARSFQLYCRTEQNGTVTYARWMANGASLPSTPFTSTVLASPPALSYHVGIRTFNANFPNTTGSSGALNNILFWKYNKSDGEFTGNVFYWSNQPTTPNSTSAFPFGPGIGVNSALNSTGKFLNINVIPTASEYCLRFFDSDPTFNNYASFIATGRDGGTVIPTTSPSLSFSVLDCNSDNFGNTILEEGDFMYLLFIFSPISSSTPPNTGTTPTDLCIIKTKKDGSGITNGLTVTSPAFNKSITFTSTSNRPLYETTGWIGGTVDRDPGVVALSPFNLTAPRVNVTAPTYSSQKVV